MTIQRMIELLEIEHECMLRGSHDDCDRNCADCELVQDDGDLHEMYTNVIGLMKVMQREREPIPVEICGKIFDTKFGDCPHCGERLNSEVYPHWCGFCGQAVKWNA